MCVPHLKINSIYRDVVLSERNESKDLQLFLATKMHGSPSCTNRARGWQLEASSCFSYVHAPPRASRRRYFPRPGLPMNLPPDTTSSPRE